MTIALLRRRAEALTLQSGLKQVSVQTTLEHYMDDLDTYQWRITSDHPDAVQAAIQLARSANLTHCAVGEHLEPQASFTNGGGVMVARPRANCPLW